MKHLDFVTTYTANTPKGYVGKVINSSFKEKFYFDSKEEFESESIKFIENNIDSLLEYSEVLDVELDSCFIALMLEICKRDNIEVEEFIQNALLNFIESAK